MLNTLQKLLKIFSDKNRLRIFKLLEYRKVCVCELASILGVTQPSVSRHLRLMKEAALIETEQDGFWTNYYLKKGNPMQQRVVSCISLLLRNDPVIKTDLNKLKTIDRTKLCCN